MKRLMIIIGLLLGLMLSAMADKANRTFTKDPAEFAFVLVNHFGGEDNALNQKEVEKMLDLLQANLPERTTMTSMTIRMIREKNARNSARGDMSEERFNLREKHPGEYLDTFIVRYDTNQDGVLSRKELTPAMSKLMGIPLEKKNWAKRAVAKKE